jgi:alanyl-tRNA synthetase
VRRAGDIGLFKIVTESGIAAGIRRIEAVTGDGALARVSDAERRLGGVAELVKGDRESVTQKVAALLERNRQLEKDLERLKQKLASSAGSDLASRAVAVDGLQVLAARLDGTDPKSLRGTVDQLKQKLGTAAIVLAAVNDDRISLVAGVSDDATDRIKAGDLVNAVATPIGGKGGGRADMAQGGGSDVAALDGALAAVADWVRARLG